MIMTLDLSSTIDQLNRVRIFDYFKKRSMPDYVEPLVTELVGSFASSPESLRRQLLAVISPEISSVLGWYARRLAGRAVRDRSRADMWNGLIAMAICASQGDFRDAMAPLALLHRSAVHLKEDPRALFETAARLSTQSAVELFGAFLNRTHAQQSIDVFGFSEGLGPDGFDYLPLLPEYGGPTPFD
jgi:hypothetical protein